MVYDARSIQAAWPIHLGMLSRQLPQPTDMKSTKLPDTHADKLYTQPTAYGKDTLTCCITKMPSTKVCNGLI